MEVGLDGGLADARASAGDEYARAGVSLRTFYRYFRTKEDAVAPLLTVGAGEWQAALAASDRTDPLAEVPAIIARLLTPVDDEGREALGWTRGLLRAMAADPALRTVWHRVNHDSETRLRAIIAELAGPGADPFAHQLTQDDVTHSEPDARQIDATECLQQAVVAPTTTDSSQRATRIKQLEDDPGVICQSPDDRKVDIDEIAEAHRVQCVDTLKQPLSGITYGRVFDCLFQCRSPASRRDRHDPVSYSLIPGAIQGSLQSPQ